MAVAPDGRGIDRSSQTDGPPATPAKPAWPPPRPEIASDASQPEFLGELDGADLLRRPGKRGAAVGELDVEVAAGEVHRDRALAPAVGYRGRGGRDGARAGGERLPRPALPDPDCDLVRAVDLDELHVGASREALVLLDERAQAQKLGSVRVAADDGVRVPDRHRRELDRLAADVDRLRLAHLDLAHLLLHFTVAAQPGADDALPDEDPDPVVSAAPREPAGGDARTVAGELGDGSVRVPDHDFSRVAVGRDHLEDPVRADTEVVVADALDVLRVQRDVELRPLHEQVVVPQTVPFRESHPRARPEGDRR